MYVLIAVFVSVAGASGPNTSWQGVSMQEFSSRQACETAMAAIRQLDKGSPSGIDHSIRLRCVPK